MTNAIEHCHVPSLILSKKPLGFMLMIRRGVLYVSVRFFSKDQMISYSAKLTKLEADQFVSSLAASCGYETASVSYKKDPLLLVWGPTDRERRVVFSGHIYSSPGRRGGNGGVMFRLKIPRNKAVDLLETIADPLGWELTEGE